MILIIMIFTPNTEVLQHLGNLMPCSHLTCKAFALSSKYAPEKLQNSRAASPLSATFCPGAAHVVKQISCTDRKWDRNNEKTQCTMIPKLLHVSSKVTHQNWVFSKHPLIQDVYFNSCTSLQQEKAGKFLMPQSDEQAFSWQISSSQIYHILPQNNINIKSRKSVSAVERFQLPISSIFLICK